MIENLFENASKRGLPLEVSKTRIKTSAIKMFESNLENYEVSDINTYNVKAKINNKLVSANFDNLSNSEFILDTLEKNAAMIDDRSDESFSTVEERIDGISEPTEIDLNKVIEDFKALYALKETYKCIDTIALTFFKEYVVRELSNSNGVRLKDSNCINEFGLEMSINNNGTIQSGYFSFLSKEYNILTFKKKIIETIEDTITKAESKSCRSNKYNVLLKNECVFDILDTLSGMFEAEIIKKGISPLNDSFKKSVFSKKITIVEDPNNDNYIGKRLFDNEGTLTYYKKIVEDGVFSCKLYNNKFASKDNTKSTGNSYGVRNMYIVPGEKTFDDLMKQMEFGILIDNVEGLHAGINKTTGNISLQAEGYLIENGKKSKPLNMIVLSTNIFELLNNVIEIGNDLEFFSITGGAPSLLLENIAVAGKE